MEAGGGAPLLVTPNICYVKLWKWMSVSTGGLLLGKMEGRFPRAFERRDKIFIYGNFIRNLRDM